MFEINQRRPLRRRIPVSPNSKNQNQESSVKIVHTFIYGSIAYILGNVKGTA